MTKMETLAPHLPQPTARAAAARIGAPAVLHAQTATLKTTAWGGKWGEVMKGQIIPAFEKEFKCKVETDSAFPYYPKLQATPKNAPLYDVLHTNTSEQWQAVVEGPGRAEARRQERPEPRRRLSLRGERQDRRRVRLHQRDRLRLSHRQGARRRRNPGRTSPIRNMPARAAATSFRSTASARCT